jgi:hypothetical protein
VREIPILFRDELVRAILADEKDLTRRVGPSWARVQSGDRLWVRETFAFPGDFDNRSPSSTGEWALAAGYSAPWSPAWYRADGGYNRAVPEHEAVYYWGGRGRWRPGTHMPRWACRLVLEVVSVTVQKSNVPGWRLWTLPDLDDAEARREGVADRAAFLALWAKLHPDYVGPVYRVQFRRVA